MLTKDKQLKFFLIFLMSVVIIASNYLVQFPFNHYGLDQILTYGAFTYPVAFLITDLANKKYGKITAKKIVYFGFFLGVTITFYFSTNFTDLISVRVAIGSGSAFIVAQLVDIKIFDKLRKKSWFVAPLSSSLIGSTIDTLIFFSIAFYGTDLNWITLAIGDLVIKILVALIMLVPFRIFIIYFTSKSLNNNTV